MPERAPFLKVGQRFGRLVVTGRAPPFAGKWQTEYRYSVRCDCGQELMVRKASLRTGNTASCGCYFLDVAAQKGRDSRTHGMRLTRTYQCWVGMWQRCTNPNVKDYKNWGGRGIAVCDRWKSFESFRADMGDRPTGQTIDRIDNDGNYTPQNCRWANRRTQAANTRVAVLVTLNGSVVTLSEAARQLRVTPATIRQRRRCHSETAQQAVDHYAANGIFPARRRSSA